MDNEYGKSSSPKFISSPTRPTDAASAVFIAVHLSSLPSESVMLPDLSITSSMLTVRRSASRLEPPQFRPANEHSATPLPSPAPALSPAPVPLVPPVSVMVVEPPLPPLPADPAEFPRERSSLLAQERPVAELAAARKSSVERARKVVMVTARRYTARASAVVAIESSVDGRLLASRTTEPASSNPLRLNGGSTPGF